MMTTDKPKLRNQNRSVQANDSMRNYPRSTLRVPPVTIWRLPFARALPRASLRRITRRNFIKAIFMSHRPKISNSILDTIGHTPLVRLNRLPAAGAAEVLVKLESFNPMCSIKDRIGAAMILAAEREGRISPGRTTLIEPTSGNTGIGLAMAAAAKGYRLILTMPDSMSSE